METIPTDEASSRYPLVSEELNSVETESLEIFLEGSLRFQKNLIVWKPRLCGLSRKFGFEVSEELNSVETLSITVWRKKFGGVSEELNSVETIEIYV